MPSAKFEDAVAALMMSNPFFSTLLLKMEHVETTSISTAAVNRKQLLYNPEFLEKLDPDEVVFVVAHEVMHQAWQHLPRLENYLRSGIGPDGQELDPSLFNQALDYPLNHALVIGKVGKPPTKEHMGFDMCLDPSRFPETMTPEEVYCILKKEQDKKGGKGKGKGQALDEHDAMTGAGEEGAITPADVMQAAQNHKAIQGTYPAGVERLIGEYRRPDVSPWRRLRQLVVTSMPGSDASTWRRLQRRYVVRGIGMPGPTQQGSGRIGVVVDTSGSIDEKMLQLFGGHMAAIMSDARPIEVLVYWTDAKVHRVDKITTPSQLRAMLSKSIPGGGGTNMPEGVYSAIDDKCDSVVVLTDGYTPFCDAPKPVIWAITSHNIKAPAGHTVHI